MHLIYIFIVIDVEQFWIISLWFRLFACLINLVDHGGWLLVHCKLIFVQILLSYVDYVNDLYVSLLTLYFFFC